VTKGNSNHCRHEVVDDLESALEQFRLITNDLGSESERKK